jgi:hypothetical protein
VTLTGGNRNDITQLIPLVEAVPPIRGRRGRPPSGRSLPDAVLAGARVPAAHSALFRAAPVCTSAKPSVT